MGLAKLTKRLLAAAHTNPTGESATPAAAASCHRSELPAWGFLPTNTPGLEITS